MPATVTVTVKGIGTLQAAISRVVSTMERGAVTALMAGGEVIVESIEDKILEQDLFDEGSLFESVDAEETGPKSIKVKAGPLPYTFVHEFGLQDQQITDRQRRFFWAMFRETQDEMWKWLALSDTYTIPARPYFRPGVDESKAQAAKAIAAKAEQLLASAV